MKETQFVRREIEMTAAEFLALVGPGIDVNPAKVKLAYITHFSMGDNHTVTIAVDVPRTV